MLETKRSWGDSGGRELSKGHSSTINTLAKAKTYIRQIVAQNRVDSEVAGVTVEDGRCRRQKGHNTTINTLLCTPNHYTKSSGK